jgi:LacI family transcriptional regulator
MNRFTERLLDALRNGTPACMEGRNSPFYLRNQQDEEPMARNVTIRDLARAAGVSVGTASRVLNGSPNVGEDLRLGVERAIMEIGFQPNAAARSMRSGNTRTIGIVVSNITVQRMAILVRSAQEELQDAGYAVLIGCHEHNQAREDVILKFLMRRGVDGLIMSYCTDREADFSKSPSIPNLPMVLFDRDSPSEKDIVRVAYDRGIAQATELLIGLGHERIALVTGPDYMYPARSRIDGFREVFARSGLELVPDVIKANSFHNGFLDTSTLLGMKNRPTALILGGVDMLPGALQAIRSHGLSIPGDISLIAAADSELARFATPAVSVVRWNVEEIGRACAQVMLGRLQNKQADLREVIFQTELVVRESCGPPPAK